MATPGFAPVSAEIKARVQQDEAVEALAKAHPVQVQCAYRALVSYYPHPSHESPHPTYTAAFRREDYIHWKQTYNDNWWIGRVVGHATDMAFLPSETKLRDVTEEEMSLEGQRQSPTNPVAVYELVPIMRPVVLMGPSTKESRLTELLQKALINFMKEQFAGRLVTIKPNFSTRAMSDKEARSLVSEVYRVGPTLKLVLLECDASFPSDLAHTTLHPMIVYIQIARQKVLQKLVKEMTANSREREDQLDAAYRLYEDPHSYSLKLSDSNLEDASQNLELFLESYWAATRSVITMETKSVTPAPSPRVDTTTESQL